MGARYRASSGRFGTRCVCEAHPNQILYYLYFVSDTSFHFAQKHYYQDLPEQAKRHVDSMLLVEGYFTYFTRRYPRLFLHVHTVISNSFLRQESMFRPYFDLND